MKISILILILSIFTLQSHTFAQSKKNGKSQDVKKMKLYVFLKYLKSIEDVQVKDSLLNLYFNSEGYVKERSLKKTEDQVERIRMKFVIDTLNNNRIGNESEIAHYKDSLEQINSKFISIKDKLISKNDRELQTKTFIGLDYGISALGSMFQVSMMKNLSQVKVSYWGLIIGLQKNYENAPPIIFGLKNISKFPNNLFVSSFSLWLSGFRENKYAGHVNSRIGRILRANTVGGHYGLGVMLGKPYRRNKVVTLGISVQKYIKLNEEYIANPNGFDLAYATKFTLGALTSFTFIL